MFRKLKNTPWLQPLWWLATLYVWFGSLYPFLFNSHDEYPMDIRPTPWLTAVYLLLLTAGVLLFREKPLYRGIYTTCRILQTLSLLSILLVNNIPHMSDSWWVLSLISSLIIIPYTAMYSLNLTWLQILLFLFSLSMTVLAILKPKK